MKDFPLQETRITARVKKQKRPSANQMPGKVPILMKIFQEISMQLEHVHTLFEQSHLERSPPEKGIELLISQLK